MNNLEWLPSLKGGSKFGWHFLSDYQTCPTYWYNRNLRPWPGGTTLGIQPLGYSAPLDIGSRFHTAIEAWYLSPPEDRSLDAAISAHRNALIEANPSEELLESIAITDRLLRVYHERYHEIPASRDYPHKQVIAVEKTLTTDVNYGGYIFTARLDVIWRHDGYLWSLEHKTTSAQQLNRLLERIHLDGQFTGQFWLLQTNYPDEPTGGVTADIIVKDRGKSEKPALVRKNTTRTPEQVEKFRLDMARRLDQIDNAVGDYRELLSKGLPHDDAARLVFDGSPDGYQCVGAFRKCDFYDLCANRRISDTIVTQQFKPREYIMKHENPFNTQLLTETTETTT